MKILTYTTLLTMLLGLSSCVYHAHPEPPPPPCYGPDGYPGLAFFGIDYEYSHPYSYWDDNPSVPYNPRIGYYYQTAPGIYEFEYFINAEEYWYGTYEIWVNPGGAGRLNCQPGFDGADTYLMMLCDPWGWTEIRGLAKIDEEELKTKPLVIERKNGDQNFKITLYKGDPSKRQTHAPKYIRNSDTKSYDN